MPKPSHVLAMPSPDPIQTKTREHVMMQLGGMTLTVCEMQARIDHLTAQLATVTQERDALTAKRA